jgi:hypothetical protein
MHTHKDTHIKKEGLTLYRATIPADQLGSFDHTLHGLSHGSGIMAGNRIIYIIPGEKENIYELFLSVTEATIMALSMSGSFSIIKSVTEQIFMRQYLELPVR